MSVHFEDHHHEIETRIMRACGRAAIGIGEQISAVAKEIVHVDSGTLRRSIHTAPAETDHYSDEDDARIGDDLGDDPSRHVSVDDALHGDTAIVKTGSWIAYACVEECGRQHRYMAPAYEQVAPTGLVTVEAAFREEGL